MDSQDCGPACLKMIAKYYGRYYSLQYLRDKCGITKEGVSLYNLSNGAENIGLHTVALKCTMEDLLVKVPFPVIIFWDSHHYIVVFKANKKHIWVSDPAKGHVKYSLETFRNSWYSKDKNYGILLGLEPTVDFWQSKKEIIHYRKSIFSLIGYFYPYKKHFSIVLFIMFVVTLLQSILPFISKAVIDVGISNSDIKFIHFVLFGNICILVSIMIFNITRDWLIMHITSRINIALISDYLVKLMRLPVTFFENKLLGDILQRAQDHERIRNFIMNNSLSLVFSIFTYLLFSIILLWYNNIIFYIFSIGAIIYVAWIFLFLDIRKKLDWQYFELISKNQSYWVETISAIQEIKIFDYERYRRWKWEEIQTKLYHVNKKVIAISNLQNLGARFIDSIKNMAIVFFCAIAVIDGDITFGVMISTQFIIGTLNGPLIQFINFVISAQYAKISFLRMNEIKELDDEDGLLSTDNTVGIPDNKDIVLENVMFQYSENTPFILNNIFLRIPQNKVTAIVGCSGSGKTTLLKILMRLYKPSYGIITLGGVNVKSINLRTWRRICGVVMQDGKLFNDTLLNNIVLDDERIDRERLTECCKIAQIKSDIDSLPKGFDTIVGEKGRSLSGGQKQRILIARALYRNPSILFLDEATNSLDTVNEKKIMEALKSAFENRTVIVVAHRLSTIINADQIVVLEKGRIREIGSHGTLIEKKGLYYRMISSQENIL